MPSLIGKSLIDGKFLNVLACNTSIAGAHSCAYRAVFNHGELYENCNNRISAGEALPDPA